MSRPWRDWDHIVKIDPDKELVPGETYEDVARTGTDAIMIGGTTGITPEKMERVVTACATSDVPLYLEPSAPNVVIEDENLAGYFVPTVFNTNEPFFLAGAHKEWARTQTEPIPWEQVHTEAYIILNPDSSVAEYTDANTDLAPDDVRAYATIAERLFGQEIVYIEYSGTLGDPEMVAAGAAALADGTLFYGGGIGDYEAARQMSTVADVIIVGDLVHDAGVDAVAETVAGATDAPERPNQLG